MQTGIGLPNHIAGVPGSLIVEWARAAEQCGFASVTTIDRLVYPGLDSVVTLTAAAGATNHIGLVTNVVLGPVYPGALLAKYLTSLASIAGDGRLTVGLGVGNRPDDYAATGADFEGRGRVLDHTVELLRRACRAEGVTSDTPLSPAPVRIPILFGGNAKATIRRVTTVGDGWAAGAVRDYAGQSAFSERLRRAWQESGRAGRPWLGACVNFAMGDAELLDRGRDALRKYYSFVPEYAELNVTDMVTTASDAAATVRAYRDLGFDALLFHPTVARLDQLERLADAVL
jgi:alkanesulfonate monooxygenase SsuD/methylene tetrahydromethanopterin reductase-like flavin-dependent oxidoreductase (luciferase family)